MSNTVPTPRAIPDNIEEWSDEIEDLLKPNQLRK